MPSSLEVGACCCCGGRRGGRRLLARARRLKRPLTCLWARLQPANSGRQAAGQPPLCAHPTGGGRADRRLLGPNDNGRPTIGGRRRGHNRIHIEIRPSSWAPLKLSSAPGLSCVWRPFGWLAVGSAANLCAPASWAGRQVFVVVVVVVARQPSWAAKRASGPLNDNAPDKME